MRRSILLVSAGIATRVLVAVVVFYESRLSFLSSESRSQVERIEAVERQIAGATVESRQASEDAETLRRSLA